MSYLNRFRINFAGGFSTNVNTANNSYPGKTYTDPVNSMLKTPLLEKSDADAIAYLKKATTNARGKISLNSEWNYMGDYETKLVGAKITSAGDPGKVSSESTLVGMNVYLLGSDGKGPAVMVDLDPTGGGIASQLFVGGIQIGEGDSAIKLLHDSVSYSYFLGNRHGADSKGFPGLGVWFQFTIPKKSIPGVPRNSALTAFFKNAKKGEGVVVRIALFDVTPSMTEAQLAQEFNAGNAPSNPAVGYAIGTISVLLKGEHLTCPSGRLLVNKSPDYCVALADVSAESGMLSLDMVHAIPKAGYRATTTDVSAIGPNIDVGELQVMNGTTREVVATFSPDSVNYWIYGGVVDIQLDARKAAGLIGHPIIVTDGKPDTNLLWSEEPYRIQSDHRGIYLDDPNQSASFALKISEYGRALSQPVSVQLGTDSSSFFPDVYPDPKNIKFIVDGKETDRVDVAIGMSEALVKIVTNGNPGISQLIFTVKGPIGTTSYTGSHEAIVRVFPTDTYKEIIEAGSISWDVVYQEVLRFYYILYPAMALRFPLNRPEIITVPGIAAQIKARIDPAIFGKTHFMPITRCMSPAKRRLLIAFLDQPPKPRISWSLT